MSWQQHQNVETKAKEACKIRKRGCSSSSSSSLIQKYRFKRAILVGKKAGSTTPVPTWKTTATKSPSLEMPTAELSSAIKGSPKTTAAAAAAANKAKEAASSISARKLGATLWEINKIPFLQAMNELEKKDGRRKAKPRVAKMAHTLPPNLSDPSFSPISEKMEIARTKSHCRRASVFSQKLQVQSVDFVDNASVIEIETPCRGKNDGVGCIIGTRARLKDVSNGLATSKQLVKVLNRICGLEQEEEEQHSAIMPLVSALRVELDRARIQVDHLIREQRSNRNETEYLMRLFAEEKAAWKRKERERIRDAIACIAEELEVEKKLRRQTERLNKKLGKELADTKALLSVATNELDSEKRAKEILEQVCDELARGIGEDRATVEELKRESVKVREEVEKEREMLHFADVLREERIQMKLSEAKYHFEEKNAVVEKLRNELEAYLGTKADEGNDDGSPNLQRIKELEAYLKNIDFGSCQVAAVNDVNKAGEVEEDGEESEADDDDSADSDLHSIELNMDNHDMSYRWSYAGGNYVKDASKRNSVEKENIGRKSVSGKFSWGSICLERGSSNSTEWDFGLKSQGKLDGIEKDRTCEHASEFLAQDYEDEIKRYRSVKSLRDHILSSNRIAPFQSFTSPTREWSQSMHFQEPGSSRCSPDLKPKLVSTRGEDGTTTN